MLVHRNSRGFTLVEMVVAMALISILSLTFLIVFKSTLLNYLGLQKQASSFGQLSTQADRVANVLRGAISVESAGDNDLTLYAYFYPSDQFVSLVRYYVGTANGQKQLYADLTPMTANPPLGTLDTTKKRTFVVIPNFYQPTGAKLFTYLNTGGAVLSTPVTDVSVVKTVQISLSTKLEDGKAQTMNLQVLLRNRKNNLGARSSYFSHTSNRCTQKVASPYQRSCLSS